MSDYKPLEPKDLVIIGHTMGLNTVEEAYYDILRHYDFFFIIDKIEEQLYEFNEKLLKAGFLTLNDKKNEYLFITHTIKEAAVTLKIDLNKVDEDLYKALEESNKKYEESLKQNKNLDNLEDI
jgi:6-pyruvoyl-tetrahydropterin synthase